MNDQPNQESTPGQPTEPPSRTSPKIYRDFADVPWSRRSGINTIFILTSMLTCGFIPLTLWTCINLLSGGVFYDKKDADGNLKQWSSANKIVAMVIVIVNLTFFGLAIVGLIRRAIHPVG